MCRPVGVKLPHSKASLSFTSSGVSASISVKFCAVQLVFTVIQEASENGLGSFHHVSGHEVG